MFARIGTKVGGILIEVGVEMGQRKINEILQDITKPTPTPTQPTKPAHKTPTLIYIAGKPVYV